MQVGLPGPFFLQWGHLETIRGGGGEAPDVTEMMSSLGGLAGKNLTSYVGGRENLEQLVSWGKAKTSL